MVEIYFCDDPEASPVRYDLTSAFVPLGQWREAHPDEKVPKDCVRHTRGRFDTAFIVDAEDGRDGNEDLAFVFDDSNPEHHALRARYKKDTNHLRSALQIALKESGLPVSLSKSGWHRLTIRLLPPFLESDLTDDQKKEAARQQKGSTETLISVHLDANRVIQTIRSYQDEGAWGNVQDSIESIVSRWFLNPSNYGRWDDLAHEIVAKLHEALDPIMNRPLIQLKDLEMEWNVGLMPPKVALMRHIQSFLEQYGECALSGYSYTLAGLASNRGFADFSRERIMDYGQQILHKLTHSKVDNAGSDDLKIAI